MHNPIRPQAFVLMVFVFWLTILGTASWAQAVSETVKPAGEAAVNETDSTQNSPKTTDGDQVLSETQSDAEASNDAGANKADDVELDEVLEGHSYHGVEFDEGPRQSARLMGGTGSVQFPASTHMPLVLLLSHRALPITQADHEWSYGNCRHTGIEIERTRLDGRRALPTTPRDQALGASSPRPDRLGCRPCELETTEAGYGSRWTSGSSTFDSNSFQRSGDSLQRVSGTWRDAAQRAFQTCLGCQNRTHLRRRMPSFGSSQLLWLPHFEPYSPYGSPD